MPRLDRASLHHWTSGLLITGFCTMAFFGGCAESETAPPLKNAPALSSATQSEEQDTDTTNSQPEENSKQDGQPDKKQTQTAAPADKLSKPISLFDNKTLEYWEEIEFGGEGAIDVENGVINFEMGDPFTGIASTLEDLPTTNYEVSLEARKTQGVDFFCGLTFPVAQSHCTLILGGWGGDVCGLSCIDQKDASTNDTSTSVIFKKDQWYRIRVRVEPTKITAWVDDKKIVDANIAGKTISLRGDTALCEPMGIASFQTNAQYRKIELRTIISKDDSDEMNVDK